MQHADLDGVSTDVLDDGVYLVTQHLGRHLCEWSVRQWHFNC
jgi:hypothetical protein